MKKQCPFPFQRIFICWIILTFSGCSVQSIHNRSYVSGALHDRTGFDLRSESKDQGFEIPEGVVLSDGLSKDEAVATALWNNAQFQADLVQLGFARADLIEAGLLQNPVLTLLFPWGPKQLEAYIHWPIDFLWQRPKRVASAKLNAGIVADNLIQHGLDLVRRVKIAYTELILTREQARIMGEDALLKGEIADISAARLKAGDISGLEETAFRLQAARAAEAAVRFVRDSQQAEYNLKTLMGMELKGKPLELTGTNGIFGPGEDVLSLLEDAFAARPDMRAAEMAVEAAGRQIGWERSKILNFTSILDANGEGKEGFEMGPGFQIELPFLNMNSGKIARAKAELERAAKQYLATRQRIAAEVHESHTDCLAAQKALRLLEEEIYPAAQNAAVSAEEAFEVGEISYLEFLEFKKRLLDAYLQKTQAEAAARRAGINLKFSTGFAAERRTEGGSHEE